MTSTDQAALVAALRRIAELENELAIHDRTAALLGGGSCAAGHRAKLLT